MINRNQLLFRLVAGAYERPADPLQVRICGSVGVRLWWLGSTAPGPGEAAHRGQKTR